MSDRRVSRINYDYLDKLFAALDKVGVDPTELPGNFARMAWERKLEFIRERYNVAVCARCKLPKPEDDMDVRYNLCNDCAFTMHRKKSRDPRVVQMLANQYNAKKLGQQDASIHELLRKVAAEKPSPEVPSTAFDILGRAEKRRPDNED